MERQDYAFHPMGKGVLVLRCRHASNDDLRFMQDLARQDPPSDSLSAVRPKMQTNLAQLLLRNHRKGKVFSRCRLSYR